MKKFWTVILAAGIALAALSAYQYLNRLSAGDAAPSFALKTLEGDTVTLDAFRGKPFLLHFWATWCGVCRAEFPALDRLAADLKAQGVAVLAVSVDGRNAERSVREFLRGTPAEMTVALDLTGKVADAYQSYGVPETFVIDASGVVVWRNNGPVDWDRHDVRSMIRAIVR